MKNTIKKTQKGFTLIELLIVIAVIAILAAIAIPNLLSSRKAANEASAISSVRTLVSAEETYRSRFGQYGAGTALTGASLVDTTLMATTGKSGYVMAVASPTATGYAITAVPVTHGTTGDRSFYADQTGVIRSNEGATASATGSPIQ